MDSRTFLIALLFGAIAAGLVAIGFSAQEKYLAHRAERPQVRITQAAPSASAPSSFSLEPLRKVAAENPDALIAYATWALLVLSYLWLLGTALRVGTGWAVAIFFGHWLASLIFLFCHPDRAAKPVLLYTFSGILFFGYSLHVLGFRLHAP